MTSIVPTKRPEMGRHAAEELLAAAGVDGPAILARRSYYRDTMGKSGLNDYGLYDDAVLLVTPTTFSAFNANADPSRHKAGVAQLRPGVWHFAEGIHNRSKDPKTHPHYTALIEAEEFEVFREDTDEYETGHVHPVFGTCLGAGIWRGWFGINLHCGSIHSTSSEGCLTIYPPQWEQFIATAIGEMKRHGLARIPVLVSVRPDDVPLTRSTP